ncbi:ArsR/SmtB family transcription factor, partial [Myceligenerans pegani]
MLRIHFTADDLGRVRLAAGADPLWETRLSARVVNDPEGARGALGQWRSEVVRDLPRQALPYLHLTPSRGYSPDFLVPETGSVDLASGIQAVLGTPAGRMAAELARLDVASPLSGWVHYLASGAPRALQGLRATITAYHRHAVAPVWDRVWSAVEADRAAHAHGLVTEGARDTLAALHPRITWSGHTLRIDDGRHDRDIHLAGRGLRLVPSYFCGDVPVTFEDPGLTPALVLPVVHSPYEAASRDESAGAALALLLGRTRAAALRALATPVTTGALARRTSASPASASQHAAVLRQAGLVVSRRDGRYVVHTLTTLGARLLAAAERGEAATGRQRPPKP